jgi:hypothetical protein
MTMIFVLATAGAVFVAGDSRQFPTLADTRQKVYLVGEDALIAQAGIGVIPSVEPNRPAWDALAVLRDIAGKTGSGSFREQFNLIMTEYGANFTIALSRYPEIIRTDPPSKIAIFFAKRASDRRVHIGIQEFHVQSSVHAGGKWEHNMQLGARQVKLDGIILAENQIQAYWSVPHGCSVDAVRSIPKGGEAVWIAALMRRVSAQSSECTAQIGGPIRIATVDSAGAHWLAQ